MKSRLICEKILIILKYSGVAPFNMDKTFTINKNFLYINRILIAIAVLMLVIISKPFSVFFENPSLATFGPAISSLAYNIVIILIIIIAHANLNGVCQVINNIMKSKERLILMLNKNIQPEMVGLTYSFFAIIESTTLAFILPIILIDLKEIYKDVIVVSSFLGYYGACYDFYYIVLILNVYHLFKALNGNIRIVIEKQKEAYDEERTETEEVEIKLKVLEMIRLLYDECDKILKIVSDIDNYFAEINLLILSNNMMCMVFTTFFCFTTMEVSKYLARMYFFAYFGSFFVVKSVLVLYFPRITTSKVSKCLG